jgi:aspartate kinase
MIVVPLQDVHGAEALKAEVARLGLTCRDDLGTVTCVGTGLNSDWSIMRRALGVAKSMGLEVVGAHASSLQLTVVVLRSGLKELTQKLHVELIG